MDKNLTGPARHGLKFKIWYSFVFLIIIIAILLWLFQIVFFNQFYIRFKEREIINIGQTLIKENNSETFHGDVYRKTNYGSMPVRIFNKTGLSGLSSSLLKLSNPDPIDIILFSEILPEDNGSGVYHIVENPSTEGSEYLVYGMMLREGSTEQENIYLYIFSQLASVENTSSVLKQQLVIITLISLIIAVILSFFISSNLVRPLTHLTDTAELLAEGNYNVTFQGGVYTEADRLADALNFAKNELSKTDSLRRELISNVSHDLRTPLTMIKAYAEMIRDITGSNSEKRKAHLDVIINESNRLTELVNDILTVSKYESGTVEIELSQVNLTEMTGYIVKAFSEMYSYEGYVFSFDHDCEAVVEGDEKKLQQVLYNLIINAANFTGENKNVSVALKDFGNKIRVEITDTGHGIPSDQMEKIWERYYRSGEHRTRPAAGTGLGLSIVKNILKLHNADYGVISDEGKGCTFWFELNKIQNSQPEAKGLTM